FVCIAILTTDLVTYLSSILLMRRCIYFCFHDTPSTVIYTLSLHDALPISASTIRTADAMTVNVPTVRTPWDRSRRTRSRRPAWRSEEHTSELQSRENLVCRLLLEKKKNNTY